mgnify:CR=1 FL=1
MGQKVNPHGFRVGVIKDWDSRWYASNEKVGDLLVEDHKIRVYLKKLLYAAGVSKIEIERSNEVVTVYLHVARPGVVIGKGGEQIEQYRLAVEKMIGKKVKLNIVEVRNPDMNAQLVAESIASQLERRIGFRRAMKQCIGRTIKLGAKGAIEDGALVILCEDRMAYILAHKDETLAVIREQAAKLNGGPIKVRVREAGDEIIQENNAKVDELIGHAQELDIEIKTL